MVPVAVQAVPFLIAALALGVALGWMLGSWGVAPAAILGLFVLFFFRDPERIPPWGEGLVVAPADGRVVEVRREPGGVRVAIFLSLFDCHINRSPVGGVVREVRHTRGRYHPAWQGRASSENERNHLEIGAADGSCYGVTQVAGVLARRIVCSKHPGDAVARGERIGLIRFGSRTDLRLPQGVEPLVRPGDRVRAGLTIVARACAQQAIAASGGRR
jgi:phosphatidylserine decarboxylase